ncbi:MAG: hypothetical protein ACYTEL_14800 [Planctomycetota bacterium]|jgi:hypothetical protein
MLEHVMRNLGREIGILLLLVHIAVYILLLVLVISFLIRGSIYFKAAARFFRTIADREPKLMRMELAKLAEEVQLLRKRLKAGKGQEGTTQ